MIAKPIAEAKRDGTKYIGWNKELGWRETNWLSHPRDSRWDGWQWGKKAGTHHNIWKPTHFIECPEITDLV